MTLTMQQIWEQHSQVEWVRTIEVKRHLGNDVYESTYQNMESLCQTKLFPFEVCKSIKYSLPSDSYSYGAVTADNATFTFENMYGETSDETNPNSIFNGYVRHKSLIRVIDGFVDRYTDPANPVVVTAQSFEGFINDELSATQFNNQESIVATDILSTLLQQYMIRDMGTITTPIDLDDLIYLIMNRTEFTTFFTVSMSHIVPGYNLTNIDMTQYDDTTTLFDLFQELSIGHSVFQVVSGVFYYRNTDPDAAVAITFGEAPERKIEFTDYTAGAREVRDTINWEGSNDEYIYPNRIYKKILTLGIKGITTTNTVARQGLCDYIGPRTSIRKSKFTLSIPFLPILWFFNRVAIIRQGRILPGSFVLDISRLDEGMFLDPLGALQFDQSQNFMIVGIEHTEKGISKLDLEYIDE